MFTLQTCLPMARLGAETLEAELRGIRYVRFSERSRRRQGSSSPPRAPTF